MDFSFGRYIIGLIATFLITGNLTAQDSHYAKKIIDTLASPAMFGRGYVNNGSEIAADFLVSEMKRIGL